MEVKQIRSGGCWAQLLRRKIYSGLYKRCHLVKYEKFIYLHLLQLVTLEARITRPLKKAGRNRYLEL
jgi:hypothetical protein